MRLPCLVIALTLALAPLCHGCRRDYIEVNGRCFRYENDKKSYEDAQMECTSEGAQLAWVGDFTETLAILDALDFDKDFWIGARYEEDSGQGYIVRQGRERYSVDEVGFWGPRQPKIKRDYECVTVKPKKGRGHRHRGRGRQDRYNEGLEWELKKCRDKKSFLCEQRCDAGQTYCGGVGCITDIAECNETPPLFECDVEHDFSTSGQVVFQSTGYPSRYPANGNCVYRLRTSVDYILKLEFDVFEMGRDNQDFIEIYVGSTEVADAIFFGRFSNRNSVQGQTVYSTNNEMVIILRSDGRTERDGRGFSVTSHPFRTPPSTIEVEIIVVIGGGMLYIESPGFSDSMGELPNYSGSWSFSAPLFTQIIFTLDGLTLLDRDSVVEIFSVAVGEPDILLVSFRGNDVRFRSFISTSSNCVVRYRTGQGSHWYSTGFKLGFEATNSNTGNCRQSYFGTSGSASSPGYGILGYVEDSSDRVPIAYPNNYDCTYSLVLQTGGNFSFWFEPPFGLDVDDRLEVNNVGFQTTEDFVGRLVVVPAQQYAGMGYVDIRFRTNTAVSRGVVDIFGFIVKYSKDCPELDVTEWTVLSAASPYHYNKVVDISCMPGFEFQDDYRTGTEATVQCLTDGFWNVTRIPTCQPVFCGIPETIDNGYVSMSAGVLFGNVAMYECFDGLNLEGNENATCQGNKTWSIPPTCAALTCSLSAPFDGISSHVLRNDTGAPLSAPMYEFGSVVELQCAEGYYAEGVTSIYCNGDDQWNGELGECKKISCYFVPVMYGLMTSSTERPRDSDLPMWEEELEMKMYFYQHFTLNDSMVPSLLFESNATVWCREGFHINNTESDSANLTCMADGSYGDIPVCVDDDECAMISPCEQECVNTPGSFYCMCDMEYTLNMTTKTSCDLIPGCDANPEACDHSCTSVDLPTWFECSCDDPYVLYEQLGYQGWYKHSLDTADEQLRVNQSCVLPQCPLMELSMGLDDKTMLLANYDDTDYAYHYNDTVKVLCMRGYMFPDGAMEKEFVCGMVDGALGWFDSLNNSLSSLNCSQEAMCDGTMIGMTYINFTQSYTQICATPFSFNITSSCDLDPETNTYRLFPEILCPEVDCGEPNIMQTLGSTNISLDCTKLGCSFEFMCSDGAQPLPHGEPATVICMYDGKWNYSNIYCEGNTCGDPGGVFGTYRYATPEMDPEMPITLSNLKYGGRLYYKCINEGFELFLTNGSAVNSTVCDGANFDPPVSEFVCKDTMSPEVTFCPAQIEVFKYSMLHGAPFDMGAFLGYGSPQFTDNAGISEIDVTPYEFHNNYTFMDDMNVTFEAFDFNQDNDPAACHIQFIVVDPVTPVVNCTELYVQINASHPEVNVTDEMIMGAVELEGLEWSDLASYAISMVGDRLINPESVLLLTNRNVMVTVTRVFYSGDVSLGMSRTMNRTLSAQCSIPIIPKPDLCADDFAPMPEGADRVCGDLADGGRECNYTCQDSNALFFQYSTSLYNTATSQCSDSSVGFTPVLDCIISGYALAVSQHALSMTSNGNFIASQECYDNLLNGYKDWIVNEVCGNYIEDVEFSTARRQPITFLNQSLLYLPPPSPSIIGFPTWNIVPKADMRGAEVICDQGALELRNQRSAVVVNLTMIDECLEEAYFSTSDIDNIMFICEDEDQTPMEAGQTTVNNVSYPIYSCFNCPQGTFLNGSTCSACPIGTFQFAGRNTDCRRCPSNTTTLAEGSNTCYLECPTGYVSENGVYPCVPCPKDTYSVSSTYCMACPADTMGRSNAQSSVASCKPKCLAGTYSEDGYASADGNCMECPVNFYQSGNGSTSCMRCANTDHTDGLAGQASCVLFRNSCPTDISARCAGGSANCYVSEGLYFCTNRCDNRNEYQGAQCDIPIDNCDRMSCDPRGTSSCENEMCMCNSEIAASGDLCDNMTLSTPCESVSCSNGGECFVRTTSYEPAAAMMEAVCLCGGQWSGASCTDVESRCEPSPCNSSHTSECVHQDVRARCDCLEGYMGYTCEVDIDGCDSSPCYNGGNCTDVVGTEITNGPFSFTCDCSPGFYGDQCEMRRDECAPDPCGDDSSLCIDDYMSVDSVYCLSEFFSVMVNSSISSATTSFCQSMDIMCENEADCTESETDRYMCDCSEIYDGMYCQHRIDFCVDEPCGVGNCSNKDDMVGYSCTCPVGYYAGEETCMNVVECSVDADICGGSAGMCVDTDGSYYCICDEEHAGMNCETNINECLFTTCYGNGTCTDTPSDYTCDCNDNRSGSNCELEVDMCDDQCRYDNDCFPAYGDYVCQCEQPRYGRNCENLPDICETNQPCAYGGDCSPSDVTYTCSDCDDGYAGDSCEEWTNECSDEPCDRGECVLSYGSGYTCECADGYSGVNCDIELTPCSPDPCPQRATCVPQGYTEYRCVCPSGFIGEECDTRIDSNFDFYLRIGDISEILAPTISEFWSVGMFTLAAWIRPDKIMNDDGTYIDIIHLTVEGEVVLRVTAHAAIFNNMAYNVSTNPELSLVTGSWAFFGVSVHTEGGSSTITIYNNGLAIGYNVPSLPDEVFGRLNVILGPNRDYVGFCSQVYLWAGASFPASRNSRLNDLLTVPVGEGVYGDDYQGSYIHYYWSIGLYQLSPFCEIGRPVGYCTTCDDPDDIIVGTYLEFARGCPDDIVVDTSSSEVVVDWEPPQFLVNGMPLTPDSPNKLPGSVFPIGRHRVRYTASRNARSLSCDFNIYVRFGCEGTVVDSQCVQPYEETGVSPERAAARCRYFGGELLMVTDGLRDRVASAITNAGLATRQVMIGSLSGSNDNPQCIIVDNSVVSGLRCTSAVAVLCGRAVTSSDSCVLPRIPSTVEVLKISPPGSRLRKYRLSCIDTSYILPSYAPRELTCYPEGNWDTSYGTLPACFPAPVDAVRFRFRIRIRFRIRVRNPCRTGGSSITYNILFAIRARLGIINARWGNRLIRGGRSLRLCCDDPNNCDTSSSCRSSRFALSCGCSARTTGRRKRATDDNVNDIEINLDELPAELTTGSVIQTPEQVLLDSIASEEFNAAVNESGLDVPSDQSPLEDLTTIQELDCDEGYVAVDGEECTPCAPGTYYSNGTCVFCPLNTYQSEGAQLSCTDCSADEITYSTGATNASDCTEPTPAGSFFNAATFESQLCAVGWFQPNASQISCEFCPVGTTTADLGSISADLCVDVCPSGEEFRSNLGECTPCEIGFYRDARVSPICLSCPSGNITEMEGSISEENCTVANCTRGTYRDDTLNQCVDCGRGNYQDMDQQEMCIDCGGNMTTAGETSTQQADCQFVCPDGYQTPIGDPASCELVPAGFYRAKNIDDPTARGVACSQYYTTAGPGAVTMAECNILECPSGMQANGIQDSCEMCPINTYSDGVTNATTNCTMCEENYITMNEGSTEAGNCTLSCPDAGEEQSGASCRPCMMGYYAEVGDQMCTQCNKTLTDGVVAWDTVGEGSTSESDCTTALCSAGYSRNNSTAVESCDICAIGYYQNENSTTVAMCTMCPAVGGASQTTVTAGSTDVNDCQITCPAGQHDVMDVCLNCSVGYFKNMAGIESCVECPENFTTEGDGSIDEMNCSVAICGRGHFSDGSVCTPCAVGLYQSMDDFVGDECVSCGMVGAIARITASTGSTSEDQCYVTCPVGQENMNDACVECQIGYYKEMVGPENCTACPVNVTTSSRGSDALTDCDTAICVAGEQNSAADRSVCERCPLNSYNPTRMSTCQSCPVGEITTQTGSSDEADCIINCDDGEGYDLQAASCRPCAKGEKRLKATDGYFCLPCVDGRTTITIGSTDCEIPMCPEGEYARNGTVYTCTPCPFNTFQPSSGNQLACVLCPSSLITYSEGTIDQSGCVRKKTCAEGTFTCPDPKHVCVDNADDSECVCHSAYDQINNDCRHICSRTGSPPFCENDGTCNEGVDVLSLVCNCKSGWKGLNCTVPDDFTNKESETTLIIVGVIVGAILLALIIATTAAFIKKCGRGVSKTNLKYAEEMPTTLGYSGAMVPAQAYYPTNGNARLQQLGDVDEVSYRGSPRNYNAEPPLARRHNGNYAGPRSHNGSVQHLWVE